MRLKRIISILCIVAVINYIIPPLVFANNEVEQIKEQEEFGQEQKEHQVVNDKGKQKEVYTESEKENLEKVITNETLEDNSTIKIEPIQELQEQELEVKYSIKSKLASSKEINDGIYQIASAVDESKVLDVAAASIKNGANIQIWKNDRVDQQKIKITYMEDGYYKLEAMHSEKVIEVAGGSTDNGANVQQYESNDTDAQRWVIKENEDGYYNIISKKSGLYLDVAGAATANGTNVQQYEGNGTKAQKFLLKEYIPLKGEKTVENGVYQIASAVDESKVLDVAAASIKNGANIQIWKNDRVDQQKIKVTYMGDGYYKLETMHSGKVIEVAGGLRDNGANVQQYESNNTDAQRWVIKKTEDGYYNIISKKSELYLDVAGGSSNNGTNVQQYEGNGTKAQKFILKEYIPLKGEKTIENGIYQIATAIDLDKVLDIDESSNKNGENVQIWSNNRQEHQKIKVTYMKDGYYKLEAMHSGKVIEVAGGSRDNGANVQQYESNDTDAQRWVIKETEDGYYNIISKKSELYLDVAGASSNNGTNVQQYEGNGTKAQKFIFIEPEIELENGTYKIITAMASNKVLDVSEGSVDNGVNVQIWHNDNVKQQEFTIKYTQNGYYTIIATHSGKALEVVENSEGNGTNVQQYESNNTDAQKWIIIKTEDGYYNIISKYNGLYLDVLGASTDDGTNVQTYEPNGTKAQKFQIKENYFGIDVSKHQGEIDFEKLVKSNRVDFMIARAGYGRESYQKDQQFERNYQQAKEYGIPIGTYLYSYATDVEGAKKEAYNMLEWIKGKEFDLPVFYDIEDQSQEHLDKQTQTEMCLAFCEIIKNAGYEVGIYTGKYWLNNHIDVTKIPEDYTMWIASYGVNDGKIPDDKYKYTGRHEIWQYTSVGIADGIEWDVDWNITHKKY